jgi:hypothetical protein
LQLKSSGRNMRTDTFSFFRARVCVHRVTFCLLRNNRFEFTQLVALSETARSLEKETRYDFRIHVCSCIRALASFHVGPLVIVAKCKVSSAFHHILSLYISFKAPISDHTNIFLLPTVAGSFFDMFPVFVLNVLVQCIFLSNCRAILRLWYALVPRVLVRKSFGHLLSLARTVAISVTELWRRPLRDSRAMIRCNTKRSRIFFKYHFRLFSCDP